MEEKTKTSKQVKTIRIFGLRVATVETVRTEPKSEIVFKDKPATPPRRRGTPRPEKKEGGEA